MNNTITRRDLFRIAAAGGAATAVGLNSSTRVPRAAAAAVEPPPATPLDALLRLRAGNLRYRSGNLTSFDADLAIIRAGTTNSQSPFAAVLACADSRVPPEIVFDEPLGNLFVPRVAGNIATAEIVASLEYAALPSSPGLNVRLIMVLGHSNCGAVSATNTVLAAPGRISALYSLIRPGVVLGGPTNDDKSRTNAQIQALLVRDSSPLILSLVRQGTLDVVAAFYNVGTGEVTELALPPLPPQLPGGS